MGAAKKLATESYPVDVFGAMLLSFAGACINLDILAGNEAGPLIGDVQPTGWYPLSRYLDLTQMVGAKYKNATPIKEKVGIEMMNLWYHKGPGKQLVNSGVGFLKFQTGSQGYHSVVKGSASHTGSFHLESLDEKLGKAVVRSTTPLDRDIEAGVLTGGMKLAGDLKFVKVVRQGDLFNISFK